jgi:hypothetical protein
MNQQTIQLNFLELTPREFSFTVYRKTYVESEISEQVYKYRLPQTLESDQFIDYCISFQSLDGFSPFVCKDNTNRDLTLKIIHYQLTKTIKEKGIEFTLGKKFYDKHIDFTLKSHQRGKEKIGLNVYFLKQENKYGFLIDFFFKQNEGEPLDREILKLSLALDNNGRSNKNFYSDRFHKVQSFVSTTFKQIDNFRIGETEFKISEKLIPMKSGSLEKKVYRFKGNQTDLNQFNGVRKYGAFQEVSQPVKYAFIFEDKYKSFANNLFFSLIGKSNPGTFSGMQQFFNLPFSNDLVKRIPLASYEIADVKNAVREVIEFRNDNPNLKVIAIFLEPDRFEGLSEIESPYYNFKFYLTKDNIPVQVVRDDQTNNANALKWSTSNIGLQIFSKLGGIPWVLKPSQNECLILGIGSAYEREEDGTIKKFFAYSVCLDSAGLYKKLDVLAEESDKEKYLKQLTASLIELFKTHEFNKYKKCALHISETVKQEAIESIQSALAKISNIEFKVLKINTHHKFFGYSDHNTYVPYESTYIKLAKSEYLVWFDGLVRGKENVFQKVGNPIHIKFLHSENVSTDNDLEYLQDAINLSGANWRGFNAKQTPISIYYAKIVADYTAAFSHFDGFDKTHFSNNLPWFL